MRQTTKLKEMKIKVLMTFIFAFENPVAWSWFAVVLAFPSLAALSRPLLSVVGPPFPSLGSVLGPAAGFTVMFRRLVGITFDWRRTATKIFQ